MSAMTVEVQKSAQLKYETNTLHFMSKREMQCIYGKKI